VGAEHAALLSFVVAEKHAKMQLVPTGLTLQDPLAIFYKVQIGPSWHILPHQ